MSSLENNTFHASQAAGGKAKRQAVTTRYSQRREADLNYCWGEAMP